MAEYIDDTVMAHHWILICERADGLGMILTPQKTVKTFDNEKEALTFMESEGVPEIFFPVNVGERFGTKKH